jgi:hypothetical protein
MTREKEEISMRSTKKEMFDLIKELQKEREKQEEAKLNPEKIKEQTKKEVVVKKADDTSETDLAGDIHSLKTAISRELTALSDKIEGEAEKYRSIKAAIALKERELEEIYGVEKAATELAVIIEAQNRAKEVFETESAEKKERLSQELSEKRDKLENEIEAVKASWDQQKASYLAALKEQKDKDEKERLREQEEYDYETARTRQLEKNRFGDELAALEKEIALKKESFAREQEHKTAELEEREKEVSQREQMMAELQSRVDAFPAELEAAVGKAVDEATTRLTSDFSKTEELLQKGFEGEKNVLLAKVAALETVVNDQRKQIEKLILQQEKAYEQVQDIASKAVAGAAERPQNIVIRPPETVNKGA